MAYMYNFFRELSIQINCLFVNLATCLLIDQLKELFTYSRYYYFAKYMIYK